MGRRLPFLMLILLLNGCVSVSNTPPSPTATATKPPGYETVACWFPVPGGVTVTCGYVSVPEDRLQPKTESNTIRLAFAIFHSQSERHAPDPVVYHVGGPGGHMLEIAPQLYDKVIAPFLEFRDLILFDPRGTGFSQPALECGSTEDPGNCVRRHFAAGHNLYAYNSSNMAADMQDLRSALGYDPWNLLAESYGTHVAQVALREAPEGLRSVILDAVLPVDLPELPGGQSAFELSLSRLIEQCQKEAACNQAYPDLQDSLSLAVQRLNEQPIRLSFELDGQERSAVLTGNDLMNQIMTAMYEADMIPYLPYAIHTAAEGTDYDLWTYTQKWTLNTDKILSQAAHWAVLCSDGRIDDCENWPVAIKQTPVTSDIPVLLLSGEFDPVTPPDYADAIAQTLPNSHSVHFPGLGHWANGTGYPCPASIIQAFLNDPSKAPDTSCVEELKNRGFALESISGLVQTDRVTIWGRLRDYPSAQDVVKAIMENSTTICNDLKTGCEFPLIVEIFPDQKSFDQHVMNKAMAGYMAISGDPFTIQMVSPSNPVSHEISYEDGVLVAVHEYVHLVLAEVNVDLPTWLDEGAAVYIGPHAPYTAVCKGAFPFELIPTFEQLRDAYQEIQAPDLFAYTAVDFIVHEYGLEQFNLLLRDPDDMHSVLGVSETEFERAWHDFIRTEYWGGTAQ